MTIPQPPSYDNVQFVDGATFCLDVHPEPPTFQEVKNMLDAHAGAVVAIDTESTGTGHRSGDVVRGVSLAVNGSSWYLPVSHPHSNNMPKAEVRDLVLAALGHPVIYHHWKFDVSVLAQLGVPFHEAAWDTWPGAWLECEALPAGLKERSSFLFGHDAGDEKRALRALQKGRSLKSLEDEHYYGPEGPQKGTRRPMGISRQAAHALAEADPRREGKSWATYTYEDLAPYAAKDAELTLRLYEHQRRLPDVRVAMPREMRWQRTLWGMEEAGIRVDRDRAQASYARATARMERIRRHFDQACGVDLGENAQHAGVANLVFNTWGHPSYYLTPNGNPSASKESLEALAFDPRVGLILEYRRLATARTRYYKPLLERIGRDGRVHASFGYTKNGRPACKEPNLLNIPRASDDDAKAVLAEIRRVFVPAEGMELWEYDLAQAELRMAAALCRDPDMMGALNDPDRDAYQELADEIACIQQGCVKDARGRCPGHRQNSKTVVLAFDYGAGDPKLSVTLAIEATRRSGRFTPPDVGRACTLSTGLRRKWPGLIQWRSHIERVAREDGRLRLPAPGRYRHFRGTGFAEPYKDAANAACQGSVAEFMRDVQMDTEDTLEGWGGRFLLEIYDSLVAEVPPGVGPKLGTLLQQAVDDLNPYPWVRHVVESKRWS